MKVENSSIRSEIRKFLEDGRWRDFYEVVYEGVLIIPPEQAVRAWARAQKGFKGNLAETIDSSKRSLEEKVRRGREKIVRQSLRRMQDVEKKTEGSQLSVRLKRTL